MRTKKRGFTLIELLVVIAIIGVLAAILIPNILSAIQSSKQTADTTNLKRLAEAFLTGQADSRSRKIPRSAGYRFWLALAVGDGPGAGNLEINGTDDPDIYLGVGDAAGLFISPGDGDAMSKDECKAELDSAVQAGSGVNGLNNADLMCSYAGPVDPRRDVRAKDNPVIGCTRDRGGIAIFSDGFSGVTTSAEARFYNFRDMTDDYQWPDGTDVPLYGQKPLERVTAN